MIENPNENSNVSSENEDVITESESKTTVIDQIQAIADEVAHRLGLRIYDIEFGNGPTGKVLRVSIDHPERGVGIEDCTSISRGMSEGLDANEEMIPGNYALEVSSPGLERQLKKPWHFQAVVGKKIKLKARKSLGDLGLQAEALKAGRLLKEEIKAADETGVTFDVGGETLRLPYDQIEKAQVVFEYGSAGRTNGSPNRGEPVNKTSQGSHNKHASKKKKK